MQTVIKKRSKKVITIFFILLLLITVPSTLTADMFVIEGVSGSDPEDTDEILEISGHHTQINIPDFSGTSNPNQHISTTHTIGSYINPLTGLSTFNDISRNRPVAVSISNARPALPSNATNGISQADIVYEFLVEGGITRMIGIYQDFLNVGVVGSIRSARHYMAEIAEAYNALFVHAGGSPLGMEEIQNRGITNFDAVFGRRADIFVRNVNRVPGHTVDSYHGLTTSGALFSWWLPMYDIQTTHHYNFRQALNFTNDPIPAGAVSNRINVRFSSGKDSTFHYNDVQNLYFMNQYGSQFTDANNGLPVTFTNLLILDIPITDLVGYGEGDGRQDMSTTGIGTGYFARGGKYPPIFWFRANKSSQFIYTYENGQEVELGYGKTYIAITPPAMSTTFN